MQIMAIVTRSLAPSVSALVRERGWDQASIHVTDPGEGPVALEAAARTPADLLLLDVACASGASVLRYRLARPGTRIVLLAPGRRPGDATVAQIVQAGVYDVVTSPEALGPAIDHPADLSAAARWLDPSLAPDAPQAQQVREVVRERRVAVSQRPVLVAVAGIAQGVGTTALTCAIAGFLARAGHETALAEANPTPSLRVLSGAEIGTPWVPQLAVYPGVTLEAVREIEQARQHPYIVVDLGVPPRDLLQQIDADMLVLVLPSEVHRWQRVTAWLQQHADAARATGADDRALDEAIREDRLLPRAARYMVLNPSPRDLRDLAEAWEAATERCIPPPAEPLSPVPVSDRSAWPPGYRRPDPALDEALATLLAPVLPDQPPPRRGLLAGFRRPPRPRRLPAEARPPEPARPAPAPRAPAPRAGGGGQHITVRVGDGAGVLDRIEDIVAAAWRVALAAGAAYGGLYVVSRIPGAPPWAAAGLGWANHLLGGAWRAVGGH